MSGERGGGNWKSQRFDARYTVNFVPPDSDSSNMEEWIGGLRQALQEAHQILSSGAPLNAETVYELMRAFHLIKGYAQPLGLSGIESAAHEIECRLVDQLLALKRTSKPTFTEIELRVVLKESVSKIQNEISNHADQAVQPARLKSTTTRGLFESLVKMARALSAELGQEVAFEVSGEETQLPQQEYVPLEAALLNLIQTAWITELAVPRSY